MRSLDEESHRLNRLLFLVAIGLLLGTAVILLVWPTRPPHLPSVAVTLRHVNWTNSTERLGRDGWRTDTFWVTNHTDRTLSITLRDVEIESNQVWISYSPIPFPGLLYFTNKQGRVGVLDPHSEGFGSLVAQRAVLPTKATWRVRASVAERLVGGENIVAAVANEPRLIEARLKTSNTNIPINPFRKDISRFGHWSDVVSEKVIPPEDYLLK